jgi:hypothetical protein
MAGARLDRGESKVGEVEVLNRVRSFIELLEWEHAELVVERKEL